MPILQDLGEIQSRFCRISPESNANFAEMAGREPMPNKGGTHGLSMGDVLRYDTVMPPLTCRLQARVARVHFDGTLGDAVTRAASRVTPATWPSARVPSSAGASTPASWQPSRRPGNLRRERLRRAHEPGDLVDTGICEISPATQRCRACGGGAGYARRPRPFAVGGGWRPAYWRQSPELRMRLVPSIHFAAG